MISTYGKLANAVRDNVIGYELAADAALLAGAQVFTAEDPDDYEGRWHEVIASRAAEETETQRIRKASILEVMTLRDARGLPKPSWLVDGMVPAEGQLELLGSQDL